MNTNYIEDIRWSVALAAGYNIASNIQYSDLASPRLDVYYPNEGDNPRPTLMLMHAGGWADTSTKETWSLWTLPFLRLGWVVVNVDYRPSSQALAPGAVEDCILALCWITRNAGEYRVDTGQVVISGFSAGGHLALTTAMIPIAASRMNRYDFRECVRLFSPALMTPGRMDACLTPAAVVNWFGITDVADLATGPNQQQFATRWIGNRADLSAIARSVSPLTYVCPGLPPTITIHGDSDPVVPYSQAIRLHQELSRVEVTNQLVTVSNGGHGFSYEQYLGPYETVFEFLSGIRVVIRPE